MFICWEFNNIKVYVGVIYRTPDADIRNFWDNLINILESLNPLNQSCYLMGDYNIDLLKHSTHNPTSELIDLMFSNNLIPLINKSTRITPMSATLIDNIFATKYENEHKYMTGILTADISDHYPIFYISLNQNKPKEEDYQMIRLINGSNLENMSMISRIMTGHLLTTMIHANLLLHTLRKHWKVSFIMLSPWLE